MSKAPKQTGVRGDRTKESFEEHHTEPETTTADLFRLHERAPIFYGVGYDNVPDREDSDSPSSGSSLDTWEQVNTSPENPEKERGDESIPLDIYDVLESRNDPERFDKCMELVELGEMSHARRLATCQKRSVELECPEHAGGCGNRHVRTVTCDSRLCPDCNSRRMGKQIGKYKDAVKSWKNPTHLVLTVENTDTPVQKKDELTDAFGRFRRRVIPTEGGEGKHSWVWRSDGGEPAGYYWKQRMCRRDQVRRAGAFQGIVDDGRGIPLTSSYDEDGNVKERGVIDGGFYGVDIKQQSDGSYNVHLHVLANMAFCPQPALSSVWEDVTEDSSPVLHVEETYGDSSGVSGLMEVIGYAVKAPEFGNVEDEVEVITGLKGSRLTQPFGSLHGETQPTAELTCPECGVSPAWWNYKGYVDMAFEGEPGSGVEGDDTRGGCDPP